MSRRSARSVRTGNPVDMEVANLFKLKDKTQFANALLALRAKYPKDEDLVTKIQDVFIKRHNDIVKKAKQFADAVRKRYSNTSIPFHTLLVKSRAHAKKHNLSDAEFAEFQRTYEMELSGTNQRNEVLVPVTNLMKVLGNVTSGMDSYVNGNLDEKEFRDLQEIIKLHEMNKSLHAQTVLQSIGYTDCATYATDGIEIDDKWMNPAEHVHPVVAAMFLPKIDILEEHFLYSNMSGIVKARYNSDPLVSRPDYELFYNLVTDPNDVVCNVNSPMSDLLHRSNLQTQLWNSVLNLRNGQPYNASFGEFVRSVDVCRLNRYDNPNLVYGRHDGTILKRLLAAFSFRPTVVATMPAGNLFATNPYSQNMRPTITSIPMINVRLLGNKTKKIQLSKSMNLPQTYIEGNTIVQRVTEVVLSREVLIFYVDRRDNTLQFNNQPFNVARLPTAIAGFEKINDNEIVFEPAFKSNTPEQKFTIASVIVADVEPEKKIVLGSSAYIFKEASEASGDSKYYYQQGGASKTGSSVRTGPSSGMVYPVSSSGFGLLGVEEEGPPERATADVETVAKSVLYYSPGKALNNGKQAITSADAGTYEDAIQKRGVVFIYKTDKTKSE